MPRRFCPRQIQITLQSVQDMRGKLVAPLILLSVSPVAIQANGIGEIFGKCLAVYAITDQRIRQLAPGSVIIQAADCISCGIGETEKNLASLTVLAAVVPGLAGINLRMMPAASRPFDGSFSRSFFRGIEIENSLAGVAINHLPAANVVVGLWTQYHRAASALVVAHFRNP